MSQSQETRHRATILGSDSQPLADGEVVVHPLGTRFIFWPRNPQLGPLIEKFAKGVRIGGLIPYKIERVVRHPGSDPPEYELYLVV